MDTVTWLTIYAVTTTLSAARLTALISLDKIFETPRQWIYLRSPPLDNDDDWQFQQYRRRESGDPVDYAWQESGMPRFWSKWHFAPLLDKRRPGFIGSVVSCPDCLGVWVAAGLLIVTYLYPIEMLFFNTWLTLAFLASWLTRKGWT